MSLLLLLLFLSLLLPSLLVVAIPAMASQATCLYPNCRLKYKLPSTQVRHGSVDPWLFFARAEALL